MFQHEKFTNNEGRGIVCAYEIACFMPVCFSSTTRLLKFLSSIRCYWRIDVSHLDLKIVCQLATLREQFEPFRLNEKNGMNYQRIQPTYRSIPSEATKLKQPHLRLFLFVCRLNLGRSAETDANFEKIPPTETHL